MIDKTGLTYSRDADPDVEAPPLPSGVDGRSLGVVRVHVGPRGAVEVSSRDGAQRVYVHSRTPMPDATVNQACDVLDGQCWTGIIFDADAKPVLDTWAVADDGGAAVLAEFYGRVFVPTVPAADLVVWVSVVRAGIEHHGLTRDFELRRTDCGRSTRTGIPVRLSALAAQIGELRPCPRCYPDTAADPGPVPDEPLPALRKAAVDELLRRIFHELQDLDSHLLMAGPHAARWVPVLTERRDQLDEIVRRAQGAG